MKIVYLTDQTFLHGGIEKVLATKANFLAEQYHHQVTVVTTEQKGHQPCYTFSEKVNLTAKLVCPCLTPCGLSFS